MRVCDPTPTGEEHPRARDVCVGDVLHKAILEVNEEATKAAAATYYVVKTYIKRWEDEEEEPVYVMNVDAPFLLFITTGHADTILLARPGSLTLSVRDMVAATPDRRKWRGPERTGGRRERRKTEEGPKHGSGADDQACKERRRGTGRGSAKTIQAPTVGGAVIKVISINGRHLPSLHATLS